MMGAIYIAGPTASGKSAVALLLAERLGGEIISVDSMQVYRGMDIGTAKPGPQERARIPHHLIDVAEVRESFDAAQFMRLARAAEADIRGRGRLPIFCGGTGLYFNALISGVGEAPGSDPGLRAELEAAPMAALLDELAKCDPETYERIDRSNPRRVIRAVEVIRLSGRAYSAQRTNWKESSVGGLWFGLLRERADLNSRIDARVEGMFSDGLVEETRELLKNGLDQNRTAMQAIGYRQVVEHLRGERDLQTTIDLVKQKTRQYAKRQLTWFRRQLKLNWINVAASSGAEEIVAEILLQVRGTES
jgi:tRNA dimethylallyltransferase